ncbi:receptor-type tyrosine-protein phosphatase kappa isoform X1 [Magallana gigas]|uniref:receptor-type tyrosine-protein phosphatase kappa isoform X1 n=1 Tax=Magallana gigas TaxID=29159 RepID=UPI00333F9244
MKDRNALGIICLILIIKIPVKAYEIREAYQSSTNGSYVASLGCDGDMDTFSLTNYGDNESWSVTLDKIYKITWIFIRIRAGSYESKIELSQQGTTSDKCSDIKSDTAEMPEVIEKIVTCSYSDESIYKLGNKLTVTSMQRAVMQVFEITALGFSQYDPELIQNVSDFPASKALDNDLETYYHSESNSNASWFLKLNEVKVVKWILISTRGGHYEIHISDGNTAMSLTSRCKAFKLPGIIKQQQTAIECDAALSGDTFTVKKMDDGPLRLFEVYPIICPPNHFGPNCARCRQSCRSCDSITGVCTQCNGSFYGEYCQHVCTENCLNTTCDQRTGSCNGSKDGFQGDSCNHEIILSATIPDEKSTPVPLSPACSTTVVPMNKFINSNKENTDHTLIGLSCVLSILTLLIAVVAILVVKRRAGNLKFKQSDTVGISSNNGLSLELRREISTHDSDLAEIRDDDPNDMEEEVITVEYNNLTSQRVSINRFIEDLPYRKNSDALEREFNDLPSGLLESYSIALKSFNRNKNRYKGIYPYDYNMVRLRTDDDEDETDGYVNASYIHGFRKERAYIASLGPFNPRTLEDFWKVIWQNDASRIVMLTNTFEGDRMKCLKYWPDTELEIGPFILTLDTEDVHDQYTLRYLIVQHQEEFKRVTQFHYTAWPDNSVPEDVTSLILFRNLVRNGMTSSDGPIVVHCSAGIGRTGTFIALDYLLEEGAAEQMIDVKGYVTSLRHQRGKSIQTYEQYIFLHDAVVEGFANNTVTDSVRQSCLSVL